MPSKERTVAHRKESIDNHTVQDRGRMGDIRLHDIVASGAIIGYNKLPQHRHLNTLIREP